MSTSLVAAEQSLSLGGDSLNILDSGGVPRSSAFRAVSRPSGPRPQLVPLVCGLCPDWLLPRSLLLPFPRACMPGCSQCGPHC